MEGTTQIRPWSTFGNCWHLRQVQHKSKYLTTKKKEYLLLAWPKKTFSDNGIILESDWRDVGQQQRAGTKSKHQLITHPTPSPLTQFDNKSSGEGQSGKGGGELKLKSVSTSWALMPTPVLEDYFAIFSEIHLYIYLRIFFCTWAHLDVLLDAPDPTCGFSWTLNRKRSRSWMSIEKGAALLSARLNFAIRGQ